MLRVLPIHAGYYVADRMGIEYPAWRTYTRTVRPITRAT
jgi:hypothetical protein